MLVAKLAMLTLWGLAQVQLRIRQITQVWICRTITSPHV
nr:MAG TPA: hypothetical protein [Caudoviricetes sp.]